MFLDKSNNHHQIAFPFSIDFYKGNLYGQGCSYLENDLTFSIDPYLKEHQLMRNLPKEGSIHLIHRGVSYQRFCKSLLRSCKYLFLQQS